MIAYNEQELLYLYHLGSSIAYKLLLDEYKNKIEIFGKNVVLKFESFGKKLYNQRKWRLKRWQKEFLNVKYIKKC